MSMPVVCGIFGFAGKDQHRPRFQRPAGLHALFAASVFASSSTSTSQCRPEYYASTAAAISPPEILDRAHPLPSPDRLALLYVGRLRWCSDLAVLPGVAIPSQQSRGAASHGRHRCIFIPYALWDIAAAGTDQAQPLCWRASPPWSPWPT